MGTFTVTIEIIVESESLEGAVEAAYRTIKAMAGELGCIEPGVRDEGIVTKIDIKV